MAVLEVNELKKSFVSPDGERTVIVDVPRFAVDDAQQIALQGSSGSGKTTFLNLIAGILKPDSGDISLAGQSLSKLSEAGRDRVRAQSIGYVFQTFNLLQGYTALENVLLGMMFGRGADVTYAKALLERVGLKDRMNYRPRQLSVGQQQRVAVARALANHPKLVLADEPTGNLDFHHATEALKLIREVCREQNAALLLVTHDREILTQFDHVKSLAEINNAAQPQIAQITQI
ncbi:MAG: ABC transporter ATP-binding protein [Candidatus Hydrogenedentes bacterium]|nr:ABC transporter ATP-binding protein [Candidatus Hydrogenedentota bacterium]